MKILGVGGWNHDPAVAVLDGQSIAFALESEKQTRHKREISACPSEVIRAALEYCDLKLSDFDFIATNWDGGLRYNKCFLPHLIEYARAGVLPSQHLAMLVALRASHSAAGLARLDAGDIPPIRRVPHHMAHLGSAYTLTNFDSSAVAIIDGAGELSCTSLLVCEGRKIRTLRTFRLPMNSLGHLYTAATYQLGFGKLGDEFKVMGLASFGRPNAQFRQFFEKAVTLTENGGYSIDSRVVGKKVSYDLQISCVSEGQVPPRPGRLDDLNDLHCDFAFELQRRLEETLVHVLTWLQKVSGHDRLCLAGGVALNAVANQKIAGASGFREIFIQPASHDAGTPLGAAAFLSYHVLGEERPHPFSSPYLGPEFSDASIASYLARAGVSSQQVPSVCDAAATAIASGEIIGWFQGRTEFGPRALGNRSILADPRSAGTRDRLNRLKGREGFRPFAPAIIEERTDEFFDMRSRSPYMLKVAIAREGVSKLVPAVVHVDNTARVQTVSREANPKFYELLLAFEEITRLPILLNTSFNLAGDPIVNTPQDALRVFYSCPLDRVFIGNHMVSKR